MTEEQNRNMFGLGNGNGTSLIEKETLLNTGYVGLWFGL